MRAERCLLPARRSVLPESQRQFPILGLNLLRLLAQNRTAEFHTELELIPSELHDSNIYIKYPSQLEQYIMEGSFNKVLNARADGLYSQEGQFFMGMLVDTVREEIAACAEKAYRTMSVAHAQQMLMFSAPAELEAYAATVRCRPRRPARANRAAHAHARCPPSFSRPHALVRCVATLCAQREWSIEGGIITFQHQTEKPLEIPSMRLIHETLSYAKELERIV